MRIWNAASSSSFMGMRNLGIIGNWEQMFNSEASSVIWARLDTFCAEPSTFAQHVDYHDVDDTSKKRIMF